VGVYVYYGRRADARRVYGGDLVLLKRYVDALDRPAVCSGLYPADEDDDLPRTAVILTDADANEFQTHWFAHADSQHEKFDRYLTAHAEQDLTGAPFWYVDCEHADPTRSPWAGYAKSGEALVSPSRRVERYQRLPGRERALAPLFGPGVRRGLMIAVLALVAIFLAITIATRPAAIGGVLPAIGWMAYLRRKDRVRPESRGILGRAAVAGAVATAPIVLIEGTLTLLAPSQFTVAGALITAVVVAGFVEESGKALCLWSFRWNPEFDERFDGIVYAGWIGLGFATVENVLYLSAAPTSGAYFATFIVRAVLAVPGHAIWAGLVGYEIAGRRFGDPGASPLRGLALAGALHGAYDAGQLVGGSLAHSHHLSVAGQGVLGLVVPVVVTAVGVNLIRQRARAALAADAAEAARLG
jgi:RsiW-degrading membrane proteinase PrsW (M82 family)